MKGSRENPDCSRTSRWLFGNRSFSFLHSSWMERTFQSFYPCDVTPGRSRTELCSLFLQSGSRGRENRTACRRVQHHDFHAAMTSQQRSGRASLGPFKQIPAKVRAETEALRNTVNPLTLTPASHQSKLHGSGLKYETGPQSSPTRLTSNEKSR